MGMVRADVDRLRALCDATDRVLTADEAATISGYVRSISIVVRHRQQGSGKKWAGSSFEELLAAAKKIPELREALGDDD